MVSENELEKYSLNTLRKFAKEIRISAPTYYNKNVLIEKIKERVSDLNAAAEESERAVNCKKSMGRPTKSAAVLKLIKDVNGEYLIREASEDGLIIKKTALSKAEYDLLMETRKRYAAAINAIDLVLKSSVSD